jgi:hypothetical protein
MWSTTVSGSIAPRRALVGCYGRCCTDAHVRVKSRLDQLVSEAAAALPDAALASPHTRTYRPRRLPSPCRAAPLPCLELTVDSSHAPPRQPVRCLTVVPIGRVRARHATVADRPCSAASASVRPPCHRFSSSRRRSHHLRLTSPLSPAQVAARHLLPSHVRVAAAPLSSTELARR